MPSSTPSRLISFRRRCAALLAGCALPLSAFAANNVVSGSAILVGDSIRHANGNLYDQVLLTGQSAVLQADGAKILRCSFLDPNGDIVQCEFSGPGQFTITLDAATFVAAGPAAKYNQPGVNYVTGKPTVKVDGNTASTYVSIFSVGSTTAVNQALFPAGQTYDGVADVQLLQISGAAMASVLAGNTRFSGASGMTGIFAPNTAIANRAILFDIEATGAATPVLQFASGSTFTQDTGAVVVAGGDLIQPNGASIDISSGTGTTLAKIVTVANTRSDGATVARATIASTVTWISGGSGTLLVDGTTVFNPSTGGSSGTFAATFGDLLTSSNSPFKFDGNVAVKWVFSGGNEGTWSVESTTTTQGFNIKSTISGTYTYSVAANGGSFTFTMNYNQIASDTGFGSPVVLNITAASNPALPKTVAVTATSTGVGTGTYQYTLTMSNGTQTTMSGNYTPTAPLGLPTS
jgi:hypothetical protein